MTTYRIIHYTTDCPLGNDYFTTTTFRQTELQNQFELLVSKLKDGESAEYMKEDKIYFHPSMLYVEKENGQQRE